MKILDIGCGKRKFASKNSSDRVIGMDLVKLDGVDVVCNIDKTPWPFRDNEFDIVIANHILEHVSDIVKTMDEVWRVSKPGALIKIKVPYHSSIGAFTDPTHKRSFSYRSMDYFSNEEFDYSFYTKKRFSMKKRELIFHKTLKIFQPIFNKFPRFYERFFHLIFPAEEIDFELICKK